MTTHFQILLVAVAGWINQHQQPGTEYFQEENRVLLDQLTRSSLIVSVEHLFFMQYHALLQVAGLHFRKQAACVKLR